MSDAAGVIEGKVREIIQTHGHLTVDVSTLRPDADLYAAGMSSHASVSVMLALEDGFEVEFPDSMLKRSVFGSIASISQALVALRATPVS